MNNAQIDCKCKEFERRKLIILLLYDKSFPGNKNILRLSCLYNYEFNHDKGIKFWAIKTFPLKPMLV
jgi:hypothetical protein